MTVLVRENIFDLLEKGRLAITPLLDSEQVGASSIDLRLGNEFICMRRPNLGELDPTKPDLLRPSIAKSQDRLRIPYFTRFVLHPHQFALGATLEYVGLPNNVQGQVVGRSSWGRLGLIIATATSVDPGFKGCITLELVNHGDVPIVLFPGVRIAQLVMTQTRNSAKRGYGGRYRCPTGPQFSRIDHDQEIQWWGQESFSRSVR